MRHQEVFCCLAMVLALGASDASAQDDVRILGTTSCYVNYRDTQKLRTEEAYYELLPGVEVKIAAPEQVMDVSKPAKDREGRTVAAYDFSVAKGPPVHVLYRHPTSDKAYVPILKCLSGESGRKQHIHVTLLTKDQYIDRYGDELLKPEMELLYRKLKKLKVDDATLKSIRDHLRMKFDIAVE
jgi:hypothetical protein